MLALVTRVQTAIRLSDEGKGVDQSANVCHAPRCENEDHTDPVGLEIEVAKSTFAPIFPHQLLLGDAVGGLEVLDGCAVARVQLDENLHIEISSVTSVGSAPIQSTSGKMFADGQRANADRKRTRLNSSH